MTVQLLTPERTPLRQMDYPSERLPHLLYLEDGIYHKVGYNTTSNLWEYALAKPITRWRIASIALLVLLMPALVWAQVPQVQVYGVDSGTIRAVVVNPSGQLSVSCANCSGSGASFVDDAAFTAASDSGAPAMGIVTSDTVDSGDVGVLAMTTTRALHTTIRDSAGDSAMDDTNNALNVNVVAGSTAGTQYTEADTDTTITGTALMFESNTGTSALSVVSASAPLPISDAGGSLTIDGTVTVTDGAGALNVIVDSGTVTTVSTVTTLSQLGGSAVPVEDAAETAGGTGIYAMSVRRDTAASSAGATGDNATLNTDATGRLWANTEMPDAAALADDTANPTVPGVAAFIMAYDGSTWDRARLATDQTEDAASAGGEGGPMVLTVRRDTAASSAGTDGDFATLNTDASGRLWVNCGTGCAGGTQYAVDDALGSTPTGTLALAIRDDALSSLTPVEGDAIGLRVDANGALWSVISGTVTVSDGSGAMNVIVDSGTVTTVSTVTTLSQLGGSAVPVEDAAETGGGTGIYAMTVRRDTAASSAGTTGDNATLNTDATGRLWVNTSTIGVEDAAETAGGNLDMVGSVRRDTAASSAGASGDNATINTDGLGRMWVRQGDPCSDYARISSVAINTASSGNVELVALNGSDLIYVCGYSVVAGAATGVQFIYGTGTACATGETDLTGVWSFAANGGITQANGGVPQFVVPAGNAFCVENSGANSIQGHVTYVRTAAP